LCNVSNDRNRYRAYGGALRDRQDSAPEGESFLFASRVHPERKGRCPLLQNLPQEEEWRTLARQAMKEQDPEKIVALAQLLVEAYQEGQRKGRRRAAHAG